MQHPLASVTMAGLVLREAALRLRGGEGLDTANHFVGRWKSLQKAKPHSS